MSSPDVNGNDPMFKSLEKDILALRQHFGDRLSSRYGTESVLSRWITGWDGQVQKIIPKLETHLTFRNSDWNLDSIASKDYLNSFSEPAKTYIPGGIIGYDKFGNVVTMDPLGALDPKGIISSMRTSELIKRRFMDTEYILYLLTKQEQKLGKRCGMVLINDLEGLSMDHLDKSGLQVYLTIISLLQDQYPDLLAKVYVIKGPSILKMAYNLVYPFLAKKTRDKVEFLGADWKEQLLQEIDPEIMPVFWGGKFEGKFGKYGDINVGGKVSSDKYYSALPRDPRQEKLTELKLARGETKSVLIPVEKPSTKLSWFISMPANDIIFGISRHSDEKCHTPGKTVYPPVKISCDLVPEIGFYECKETGHYKFTFDNSFSMVRGKTIKYHISKC